MIGYRPVERWRWQGSRCKGRKRKTWHECVEDDMRVLDLHAEWAVFRDRWRDFIWYGQTSNPSVAWRKWTFSK